MNINSRLGKVTVIQDRDGCYLLGPIKHPGHRPTGEAVSQEALYEAHEARKTRSKAKAQEWADRAEGML